MQIKNKQIFPAESLYDAEVSMNHHSSGPEKLPNAGAVSWPQQQPRQEGTLDTELKNE